MEHLHIDVGGSLATSDANGSRFVLRGRGRAEVWRRMMLLGAASFCVVGATLGALQASFAWQPQHLEHLRLLLRDRGSSWSTFIEVGGSLATSDANGRRFVLRGRRSTWSTSGSFCVAGAALGALQALFAWQAQLLEHVGFVLNDRRSTWSTFI